MNTEIENATTSAAATVETAAPEPALAPSLAPQPEPPAAPVESKTVAELQAELAAANTTISALQAKKNADEADEVLILDKIQKGLSRAQATAVVRRQHEYDRSPYGKMCRARHEARQLRATRI